jgi:hypothetical protein
LFPKTSKLFGFQIYWNMGSGGDGDSMGGGMYIIEKVRRATSGTETANPSGGPEIAPCF